jgi:endoglucanase
VSTEATASFVAVMARASRAYRPFDADFADECLAAAERGYAYLSDNPAHVSPDLSAFLTGAYKSDDRDDRFWADVEMWITTGDSAALAQFEAQASNPEVGDDWDWGGLWNLGWFSYALAPGADADPTLKEAVNAAIIASAERLSDEAESDSFFRALGPTYYWGANGLVARSIMNLSVAHRLTADERYQRAALAQLHHLLGVNVQGRSFVTGLGFLPPLFPHHRPSGADFVDAPWPGLLVGGPNPQTPRDDPSALAIVENPNAPAPLLWQDDQVSYWTNEVAVNWNAPLVYGLAWFQK